MNLILKLEKVLLIVLTVFIRRYKCDKFVL